MLRVIPTLIIVLFALLACGGADELENLKTRSAFDLKCPESAIQVRNLDDQTTTYGVTGCGKQAVYIWACNDSDDCKWVLNSFSDK